jgi:MFS family permease
VYLIAATTFAGGLSRGFLIPLRAHELGASRLAIGLLATVGMMIAAFLSLPAGFLTDRLGRRAMTLGSVVLGLVAQVICAVSPTVWPFFLAQLIGGLGFSAAQTALFAALADTVDRPRIGRAMGWLTFSMQAGFLAGPAVAGLLLSAVSTQTDLGLMCAFWVAALPFVAFLSGERRRTAWSFGPARQILNRPGFQAAVVGAIGLSMLWGTLQGYLPVFAKEALGLPGSLIGYMLAIQAGANGLSRIAGGRLVDRLPRQWPLVVLALGSVFVLPHLSGFGAPAALLAFSVPFIALGYIALSVTFANLSTDANRGLVMGFYSTALFVGLGLGPAAFGPAMQASYTAGFTACAATALVTAGLVPLVRWAPRRTRRPELVLPPAAPGT